MTVRPTAAAAMLAVLVFAAPLTAQIAAPRPAMPRLDTMARTTVTGIVYDSIAMRRLPAALVQLVPAADPQGTSFGATTSENGRFRIDSVPPGQYLVGFFHAEIDAMGLALPTRVTTIAGPQVTLVLSTPSPATLALALCPAPPPGQTSGALTGFVRNADTGEPLPGSSVVMLWTDVTIDEHGLRQQRRQFPIPVGEDGRYTACDVPTETPLTLRAELGAEVSGFVETTVPTGGLRWRDFGIGISDSVVNVVMDSTAGAGNIAVKVRRGEARLSGTVRTADGQPVRGATVVVWGSGVEAVTDAAGRFILTGLPSGTHNLEVRSIGYQPARMPVDLGRRKPTTVVVALEKAVPVLDPVEVVGERAERDATGFDRRSRGGFGDFITSEEIEKRHAIATSDLLRMTPGVQVISAGPMGATVLMRGCRPTLWIDGMKLMGEDSIDQLVQPSDIVGIEIYRSAAETPPQFSGGATCGTIVVWTGARKRAAR